jgi:uncharacterized protein
MKMEQSFEVKAPLDVVWAALIDLERVAPCLPGASITGHDDDGTYHGTFQVKLGPTTAAYNGTIKIEDIDEANHTATLRANGTDKRGQGGAKATIVSKLSQTGDGTRVDVVTDYHITGRLARFGRGGMIEDISERLLREFANRLQASLTEPAAEPVAASSNGAESASGPGAVPQEEAARAEAQAATGADAGPTGPPIGSHEAQPLEALPLVAGVLRDRIRANPLPLAALLGFLLAVLIRRRARS